MGLLVLIVIGIIIADALQPKNLQGITQIGQTTQQKIVTPTVNALLGG